jgi:hypothetical protein
MSARRESNSMKHRGAPISIEDFYTRFFIGPGHLRKERPASERGRTVRPQREGFAGKFHVDWRVRSFIAFDVPVLNEMIMVHDAPGRRVKVGRIALEICGGSKLEAEEVSIVGRRGNGIARLVFEIAEMIRFQFGADEVKDSRSNVPAVLPFLRKNLGSVGERGEDVHHRSVLIERSLPFPGKRFDLFKGRGAIRFRARGFGCLRGSGT